MPTMTNPGPRPITLRATGRIVGAGDTTDMSTDDAGTPGLRPAPQPNLPPPPSGNARTDRWADYARNVLHLDVDADASRDQIKAAVAAHSEES